MRKTFRDIRETATTLGPHDITIEHECYDVGLLLNLKSGMGTGLFNAPVFIQFVMGIFGGIGADVETFVCLKKIADKLVGDSCRRSVLAVGAAQIPMAKTASRIGGHVRVGRENSLFISRGEPAQSNAQLVAKIRSIVEALGMEVAVPDAVREILDLKGGNRVAL